MKNYYSNDKKMGVMNGEYFTFSYGFNVLWIYLKVRRRVAQSIRVISTHSSIEIRGVTPFKYYDSYIIRVNTCSFSSEEEIFDILSKRIIISKSIDFKCENAKRVSIELFKTL